LCAFCAKCVHDVELWSCGAVEQVGARRSNRMGKGLRYLTGSSTSGHFIASMAAAVKATLKGMAMAAAV
jgi:hypothetical protein